MIKLLLLLCVFMSLQLSAQENTNTNPFRQLGQELPTPNSYRNASGAPGHEYWQQKADYDIKLELDDENMRLYGEEVISYFNNSPDELSYLWLQLDQNVRSHNSDKQLTSRDSMESQYTITQLNKLYDNFDGGFKIEKVTDIKGKELKHIINKTMMRVNLPDALKPGGQFSFRIKWWYNINDHEEQGGRSGFEHFNEDGNNVYVMAQFFPRMCSYNDVEGWQNKQFLGRGEFTLIFGNYNVEITVPADHLVAATGELQNSKEVLTIQQIKRLAKAKSAEIQPVPIATKEEAAQRMKSKSKDKKTWKFYAENVRDFGFATSRRFIWDAMGVKMSDGRTVLAQSMWVKEGDCLWSKYSTKAVAHSIKWYSHYTIDYPYPVSWSIDGSMGMEYPMITFNYGRCEDDNTYTHRTKYSHIGVIIHEVGHNWFPMIINSDERQWTWMDEGLNTFVQYLVEQHWERDYPSRRGPAHKITSYMGGDKSKISPIMINSESIWQFGPNAYAKPATALNILRESIMGRDLFDYAFKEYCNRWKFKHPMPADFFRTMEDASAVDLDWFWRGWFFTTDHVDISLDSVKAFESEMFNPVKEKEAARLKREDQAVGISKIRNRKAIKETLSEKDPSINDFYSTYDPLAEDLLDQEDYHAFLNRLSPSEKEMVASGKNFYELSFKNVGGLIMPIIFEFKYEDGTSEVIRIPAEIWRMGEEMITKVFATDKKVVEIVLDPYLETADVDTSNNYFPPRVEMDRFDSFKKRQNTIENPMQRANRAQKKVIKP